MKKALTSAVAIACLAACGGGGNNPTTDSDGSKNGSAQPQTNLITVTSSNYETVSQSSFRAAQSVAGISSGSSVQFLTGAVVGQQPSWLGAAIDQIRRRATAALPSGKWLAGANISFSESCSTSGRIDATLLDLNGNEELDAGESARFSFVQCNDSGLILSGTMRLSLNSGNLYAETSSMNVDMTVTYESFSVGYAGFSSYADGTMRLKLQGDDRDAQIAFSSSQLTVAQTIAGLRKESVGTALSSNIRMTWDAFRADYLLTQNLTSDFKLSELDNQSVQITTPVALKSWASQAYPYSGQLVVKGKANSKLRLTAMDSTQVKLELDSNGDDAYEASSIKAWSSL